MWTFLKYTFLLVVVLIVIPAGYLIGPLFMQVNPDNVEGRLYRVCLAGALQTTFGPDSGSKRSGSGVNISECGCIAQQAVNTLGAPLAAQLTEATRQFVVNNITSRKGPSFQREVDAMGRSINVALRMCRSRVP